MIVDGSEEQEVAILVLLADTSVLAITFAISSMQGPPPSKTNFQAFA